MALPGYLTPGVVGATLLFFMVKPILARPSRRQRSAAGRPDSRQPALFALIRRDLPAGPRAAFPASCRWTAPVNASAGFAARRRSRCCCRRDLVLTIGLPLAAGLSIRELARRAGARVRPLRAGRRHAPDRDRSRRQRVVRAGRATNATNGTRSFERMVEGDRLAPGDRSRHGPWRCVVCRARC